MKVLFFVNEFPKLSETFILNQIKGLVNKGHQITILARNKENNEKVHKDVEEYNLENKVIYYRNYSKQGKFTTMFFFLLNVLIHYMKKIFNKRYKGNIPFIHILKQRDLLFLLKVCNKNEMNFDIIQAHFGPNGAMAQVLIDQGLIKGNLYTTFHGYDMLSYVRRKGENVYKHLFSSNNVLLPISEYWKKKLIEFGADPSKIYVHHMGIDIEKFKFKPVLINKGKQIKILSVARFVEKKGLIYGISAVSKLIKEGYNINYTIIGGGPLEEEYRTYINSKGLSNYIELIGWRTQEEIVEIMENSHIMLLPSITSNDGDMEGIPVILMEAMAMGKIVVSTRHSGIPELIDDKINGFLVDEKDINGLSTIIKYIVNSRKDSIQLQLNARRTIEEKFNIEILNNNLIEIFNINMNNSNKGVYSILPHEK